MSEAHNDPVIQAEKKLQAPIMKLPFLKHNAMNFKVMHCVSGLER